MDKQFASKFAKEWVDSWNSHEINSILSHYTDDFEIESPLAKKRFPESNGVLKGKIAIKKYWSIGLKLNPDLEFEIIEVLVGVNTISIFYLSKSTNKKVIEMMKFNQHLKVTHATVNYT